MLFVSHASLLESLLSIAVNVLLTGHFIMLLTPWGMIPEKYIIVFGVRLKVQQSLTAIVIDYALLQECVHDRKKQLSLTAAALR